jgi:hypothetical protein
MQDHIDAVKKFKLGAGQSAPDTKTEPTEAEKITCVRLLIEEALEMAEALGVYVGQKHNGDHVSSANNFTYYAPPDAKTNFVEVLDAAVDIMWVGVTGPLALCGMADKLTPALAAVDANNLLKLANGHKCPETGKFIKPKDHPKVDLESIVNGPSH